MDNPHQGDPPQLQPPFTLPSLPARLEKAGLDWRSYGGDAGGKRFSPLQQITRKNIGSLKRAWTYHLGELDRSGNETDRHRV